jgi:hypothetical protein
MNHSELWTAQARMSARKASINAITTAQTAVTVPAIVQGSDARRWPGPEDGERSPGLGVPTSAIRSIPTTSLPAPGNVRLGGLRYSR